MSTVGDLIERALRDWLWPKDDMPTFVPLSANIDGTTDPVTITYDADYLDPSEEDLIDQGSSLQIDSELFDATDIDTSVRQITATRGADGTALAAHTAGTRIFIDTWPTRVGLFNAICDAVENISPPLYRVVTVEVWTNGTSADLPLDVDATVLFPLPGGRYQTDKGWKPIGLPEVLQDFPDSDTGVAIQLTPPFGQRNYVRLAAALTRPTDESTAVTGLERYWDQIVVVDAVSQIIATRDAPAATQEYITDVLAQQGFQVGQGESLRNGLLRYRDFLLGEQQDRLRARDPLPVETLPILPGW